MKRFPVLSRICKAGNQCSRLVVHGTNLLLATMAVLQTSVFLLLEFGQRVQLPQPVLHWLIDRQIPEEYQIRWQRVDANLAGEIFIEGLSIESTRYEDRLLEIDRLAMDLGWDDWFIPQSGTAINIWLSDLRAQIPPVFSPSGVRETLLHLKEARITYEDDQFRIHHLHALSGRSQLHAYGTLPAITRKPALGSSRAATDDFVTRILSSRLLHSAHRAMQDHAIMIKLSSGILDHEVTMAADAMLEAFGDPALHAEEILVQIRAIAGLDSPLSPVVTRVRAHARIQTAQLDLPDWALAIVPEPPRSIRVHAHQDKQTGMALPARATAVAHMDGTTPLVLDFPTANGPSHARLLLRREGVRGRATFPFPADPLRTAPRDWLKRPMEVHLELAAPFFDPFIALLPEHRILVACHAGLIQVDGTLNPAELSLNGVAQADTVHIGQTDFEHIFAHFTLNRDSLDISDSWVQKNRKEFANGSYQHAFSTQRFSMNLRGSLLPTSLDGFLGNWWKEIFNDLEVQAVPEGDVCVWGNWNEGDAISSVTTVFGSAIAFFDVLIPQMHLRVRNNADWTVIEHVRGTFPSGHIQGMTAWPREKHVSTDWRGMTIELSGDVNWNEIRAWAGAEPPVEFDANPRWQAEGTLWQRKDPPEGATFIQRWWPVLQLTGSQPNGDLHFQGWALHQPQFSARVNGRQIAIDQLRGSLAGGRWRSTVDIGNWTDATASHREIRFDLSGASLPLLVGQWHAFRSSEEAASPTADGTAGLIGKVYGSGDFLWAAGATEPGGIGILEIRDGNLGSVNILGPISRILGEIGLNFTRLDLNNGLFNWRIADGNLLVANSIVSGPVLKLQIDGTYDYRVDELDAEIDISLFGGVFSRLLAPLSRNFSVQLSGPWKQPAYTLNLRPFRWFQEQLGGTPPPENQL